ncbi:hypothetical protein ABMA28_000738 [Loxostege sticticalis]|uniref:RNA-directed DNA polymerase n=1 Tax=Loxostege sticticalis TaxID=481309 RepID=A0ABD0T3E1_LOXSC
MSVHLSDEQFQLLLAKLSPNRRGSFAFCTSHFEGEKNSEAVEAFLAAASIYKSIENIPDKEALDGVPLLLRGEAAIWWQGVKKHVTSWEQFGTRLRNAFAPKKPAYILYQEIIGEKQEANVPTEQFIAHKRMLFAQLPAPEHTEEQQLSMIFGQLHIQIREKIQRTSVKTYDELLTAARGIEELRNDNKVVPEPSLPKPPPRRGKCSYCHFVGHSMQDCRKLKRKQAEPGQLESGNTQRPSTSMMGQATQAPSPSTPRFSCYGCGTPGVVRSKCPNCAKKKPLPTEHDVSFCAVNVRTDARPRPVVFVNIEGVKGTAYIDTCAKASIASHSLYKNLLARGNQFRPEEVCITLADGVEKLQKVLTTKATVRLEGRSIPTTFIVLPGSTDNRTLLGVGFIQDANLILNLPQYTFRFADEDRDYELFQEDFVHFSSPSQRQGGDALATLQVVNVSEMAEHPMRDEQTTSKYRLIPIDFTPPAKKTKPLFDGFTPSHLDYMMSDAETNFRDTEVTLSPRSQELFPPMYQNFSAVAEPLSRLTKKNSVWKWEQEQEAAYKELKKRLTSAPVLRQADELLPYTLKTDASNYALGAVLEQGEGDNEHPVEYASRLLNSAERNYTTTEREALAVVWALNRFRGYVEGVPVTVVTDHQALRWLMNLRSPTGRLARWALLLQAYDITIRYLPGRLNRVADALSRPICDPNSVDCGLCEVSIDMPHRSTREIRQEQMKDKNLQRIIEALEGENVENGIYWSNKGYCMNNGLLYRLHPDADTDDAQLLVPEHEWANILGAYHDDPLAGHYGADKTYEKIAKRYYWSGMRKYIESYVRKCVDCQRFKPSNQKPAGLLQTTIMNQRFEIIAFDLFGPLPPTNDGKTWILVVEDVATRWVELFALNAATAENCAMTLINEVFLRYGVPRRVTSDNGTQFVSAVMQQVTYCLKIKHSFTPVKNRDLKTQLAILVQDGKSDWSDSLPAIRFAMNTTTCLSTNHTAAYLTFGRELRSPCDNEVDFRQIIISENFIPEITPKLKMIAESLLQTRDIQEKSKAHLKEMIDKQRRRDPGYKKGDLVLVELHPISRASQGISAKFAPRRDGPYMITRQHGPASYEVASPNAPDKPIGVYHSSALTAFRNNDEVPLPQPVKPLRKRGRPKKTVLAPSTQNPSRRGRGRPRK